MARATPPFSTPDLSALARHLSRELTGAPGEPGHPSLMNMLARMPDCRDYQRIEQPPPPEATALIRHLHA